VKCDVLVSCKGLVNGKQHKSVRVDDDYNYYNDYELMKVHRGRGRGRGHAVRRPRRRGYGRRNASSRPTAHAITGQTRYLLLSTVSVLLLINDVDMIGC